MRYFKIVSSLFAPSQKLIGFINYAYTVLAVAEGLFEIDIIG
jgi:hypothetical protein